MSTEKVVVLFSLKIVYVKNRSVFKTVFIQGKTIRNVIWEGGLAKYRKPSLKCMLMAKTK